MKTREVRNRIIRTRVTRAEERQIQRDARRLSRTLPEHVRATMLATPVVAGEATDDTFRGDPTPRSEQ